MALFVSQLSSYSPPPTSGSFTQERSRGVPECQLLGAYPAGTSCAPRFRQQIFLTEGRQSPPTGLAAANTGACPVSRVFFLQTWQRTLPALHTCRPHAQRIWRWFIALINLSSYIPVAHLEVALLPGPSTGGSGSRYWLHHQVGLSLTKHCPPVLLPSILPSHPFSLEQSEKLKLGRNLYITSCQGFKHKIHE